MAIGHWPLAIRRNALLCSVAMVSIAGGIPARAVMRIRRAVARRAVPCVLAALAACAHAPATRVDGDTTDSAASGRSVGGMLSDYGRARVLDLSDIVALRIGVGPGLLVQARATRYVALGVGSIGPAHVFSGGFRPECYFLGWNGREGGVWIERRTEYGISTFYGCEATGESQAGNVTRFGLDGRRTFDVGAEAYLALVGLAVDARVEEALDFVAGIFGFDPEGDDTAAVSVARANP